MLPPDHKHLFAQCPPNLRRMGSFEYIVYVLFDDFNAQPEGTHPCPPQYCIYTNRKNAWCSPRSFCAKLKKSSRLLKSAETQMPDHFHQIMSGASLNGKKTSILIQKRIYLIKWVNTCDLDIRLVKSPWDWLSGSLWILCSPPAQCLSEGKLKRDESWHLSAMESRFSAALWRRC